MNIGLKQAFRTKKSNRTLNNILIEAGYRNRKAKANPKLPVWFKQDRLHCAKAHGTGPLITGVKWCLTMNQKCVLLQMTIQSKFA